MKMIVRSNIVGVDSDEGLYALNGIKEYEADVKNAKELIDMFTKEYPDFCAYSYEIIDAK